MTGNEPCGENAPVRTLWSRGEIVFAAAAAALAAGVFAPIPELVLDILWVCVLSLTIAVGVIFPTASSTADLKGFAAMLSGPALLRIGLVGALCTRLFGSGGGGLLIPAAGKALTSLSPLAAALVCLVGAVFLAAALFGACQRIAGAAERYRERIFALKCVGIETDLKMGVITERQARALAEKVHIESRLFSNLSGASLLMRAEGAIEIAAMLLCLIGPFFGASRAFASGADRIAQAASAAVGLTAFSLVPAVVSALAGAYLAAKDSLTLRTAPAGQQSAGRTFTLIDQETGQCEEVELLNPDFAGHAQQTDDAADQERIAEFEPEHPLPVIETLTIPAGSPPAYYGRLAGHVVDALTSSRVIVFAAQEVRHLPVTVFVNTAIRLVQEGRTILLVDADTQRHALAQVFEADVWGPGGSVRPTGFEGLSLFGLSGEPERIKATLTKAAQTHSCVLIYAPDAVVQQQLENVLSDAEAIAFVFGVKGTPSMQQTAAAMHYCRQLMRVSEAPMQGGSD